MAAEAGPWDQVEVDLVLLVEEDVADFEGGVGSFQTSIVVVAAAAAVAARLFPLRTQIHKSTPPLQVLLRRPHRRPKRAPR